MKKFLFILSFVLLLGCEKNNNQETLKEKVESTPVPVQDLKQYISPEELIQEIILYSSMTEEMINKYLEVLNDHYSVQKKMNAPIRWRVVKENFEFKLREDDKKKIIYILSSQEVIKNKLQNVSPTLKESDQFNSLLDLYMSYLNFSNLVEVEYNLNYIKKVKENKSELLNNLQRCFVIFDIKK